MKTNGDFPPTNQRIESSGDLKEGQEKTEKLNISEESKELKNSMAINFLRENPEGVISEISKVLKILDNLDWWYVLTKIKVDDGTNLIRITIASPETHNLDLLGTDEEEYKEIVIRKK